MLEHEQIPFKKHIPRFPAFIDPATEQLVPAEPRAGLPTARTTVLFSQDADAADSHELSLSDRLKAFVPHSDMIPLASMDYLDESEADREGDEIDNLLVLEHSRMIGIGGGKVERKDYNKFIALEDRRQKVVNILKGLEAEVNTIGQRSTQHVLRLGASSLYHNLTDRILEFNHQHNSSNGDTFFPFDAWAHGGYPLVKFGGINSLEFVDKNPKTKPPLADAFRFLVDAAVVTDGVPEDFDEALANCDNELFQRYPNISKNKISLAGTAVAYIVDYVLEPEFINASIAPELKRDKDVGDVIDWTKRYITRAGEVGISAQKVLSDPTSSDFAVLAQEIQGYFAQGKNEEIRVLNVLGMKNTEQATALYRKARELALAHPEQTSFYSDLADAVREFEIEMPVRLHVLTADDIPTFLDEEQVDPAPAVTVETIAEAVNQIHPSGYGKTFSIDPENIDWEPLAKPADVKVVFDKAKYKSFSVKMTYQNAEGESSVIEAQYQTYKGTKTFDLNFLEDRAEIPMMYQAIMSATQVLLGDVKRQAEERRAVKIDAAVPPKALATFPKNNGELVTPVIDIKTKVKTRPEQAVELYKSTEIIEVPTPVESGRSKLTIDELSQRRLNKQLERLSYEDRDNILETIERFNNGESVRFYPLKQRGPNNEVFLAVRSKATVRGGSRILVTPIEGSSDFAVIAAGYRKDIYRDWGLD